MPESTQLGCILAKKNEMGYDLAETLLCFLRPMLPKLNRPLRYEAYFTNIDDSLCASSLVHEGRISLAVFVEDPRHEDG